MACLTVTPHRNYPRSSLWAMLAMACSFAFAYGVDHILRQLRIHAGSTFQFRPFILISAVLPLIVVALILALGSLVLDRLPPSPAVGATYLVCGLVVAIVYVSFLSSYPMWLRATFLYRFQHALVSFGSQSAIYYLASAWVVIGGVTLRRSIRSGAA